MKRFVALIIYTLVIVGGSYFYQDSMSVPSFLYVGITVIAIAIIGMLNPGLSSFKNGKSYFDKTDFNDKQVQEKMSVRLEKRKTRLADINFLSIMTYLYLLVPFFISIILFVE